MILLSEGDLQESLAGMRGYTRLTGNPAVTTGKWCAIFAVANAVATVITTLGGTITDGSITSQGATYTSIKIPAGCTIYGYFTSIDLASGTIIAYKV